MLTLEKKMIFDFILSYMYHLEFKKWEPGLRLKLSFTSYTFVICVYSEY